MRRLLTITLLLCALANVAMAQRITHNVNNVSMSDALKYVQQQTSKHKIIFIYNELEDFKVTTSVRSKSVPEAIKQLIGFYPIRMTQNGDEIYVECTHKSDRHLTGKIIDENGLPLEFADVRLLNPSDSSYITGGITNASGVFVIPLDLQRVIARFSYIGYKPVYKLCSRENVGTIQLQIETTQLGEVTVKGARPQYKMTTGGMTVNVSGTLLSDMGTCVDVLGQLPRVNVKGDGGVNVFGCGTPLIYINNRLIQNNNELQRLKSSDIKSIDIITSPGARYQKNVSSVIRIHTIKPQGDGFSVSTTTNIRNNHEWGGYEDIDVKYRTHGLELFAEGYWRSSWMGEDNNISNELFFDDGTIRINQIGDTKMRSRAHYEKFGINYDIGERHSLGASYTLSGVNIKDGSVIGVQQIWHNGNLEGYITQDALVNRKQNPLHDVNVYYVGQVGNFSIDFNGTWYHGKDHNIDARTESSDELDCHDVLTQSWQSNQMTAGKLIASHSLWKGTLSIGSEMTYTRTDGEYCNDDQTHQSSDTRIHESNLAAFAEYNFSFKNFTIGAGLRFEHIVSHYYSSGVLDDDASRNYNDWFPNASIAWKNGKWNCQFNYSRRIHRPTYWMLRNFIQYDNRYTYEGGNPLLRPQLNHNLELSAIYSWLSVQVRYTYGVNTMAWAVVLDNQQRYVLLCNRNFDNHQRLSASIVASPKFGFYRPSWMLAYNKLFFDAERYGSSLKHHRPLWRVDLKNTFDLGRSWTAMLNVRICSDADDEFLHVRRYWTVGVRINKSFFNKALRLNLYANDIFKTSQERWTMYGTGANLNKDCYNYDRTIGLTITYNFNSTKSKYKGTGAGNDEKSRL